MFKKILIANRGEIALRVARSCRELGVPTVAVYSSDDRESAVVRFADEAVHIGPAPARASYLNASAIVEAALQRRADAVHPGYGFLSEDPDFAEICEAEGLTFIGPPAAVLGRLGDKSAARSLMAEAGLPLLPGTQQPVDNVVAAERAAADIGYPLIIKAVAGGGGRGTAVVRDPTGLRDAYAQTRASAKLLFGDGRVYLERFLDDARHVEIQILCDSHGNGVELGARDCSIQRRNQKLIEETPAPGLAADLVARMSAHAASGARAAGYVGAGTFEFLVDRAGSYYFMEVNSRIQVEHPVTEMVTGVDLVAEQIRVAAGLPLRAPRVEPRGVSIECRVNVEDPDRGFVPTPGVVTHYQPPAGPFVRVDTHGFPGMRMSPAYDSLLAKVVVWAPDRAGALARMQRALSEFEIAGLGVRSTLEFLQEVLRHPSFQAGEHNTRLVGDLVADRAAERLSRSA
jgi:acetyl-CoA carboxylase biotin carboxylase subunit